MKKITNEQEESSNSDKRACSDKLQLDQKTVSQLTSAFFKSDKNSHGYAEVGEISKMLASDGLADFATFLEQQFSSGAASARGVDDDKAGCVDLIGLLDIFFLKMSQDRK